MIVQIEYFNFAFLNCRPLEFFLDRHSLNVCCFHAMQPSDHVL